MSHVTMVARVFPPVRIHSCVAVHCAMMGCGVSLIQIHANLLLVYMEVRKEKKFQTKHLFISVFPLKVNIMR